MYPRLLGVGIEAIFSGRKFYRDMLVHPFMRKKNIPLIPITFKQSKGYRYEKIMVPLFKRKRMYLSTEPIPYLKAFKSEWLSWQGDQLESLFYNDTLDATFAGMKAGESLITPLSSQGLAPKKKRFKTNSVAAGYARK